MYAESVEGQASLKLVVVLDGATEWVVLGGAPCHHKGVVKQEQPVHGCMLEYPTEQSGV